MYYIYNCIQVLHGWVLVKQCPFLLPTFYLGTLLLKAQHFASHLHAFPYTGISQKCGLGIKPFQRNWDLRLCFVTLRNCLLFFILILLGLYRDDFKRLHGMWFHSRLEANMRNHLPTINTDTVEIYNNAKPGPSFTFLS